MADPFNDCVKNTSLSDSFESDLYKLTIKYFKTYRRKACFDVCYQKYIAQNCGCYSALFNKLESLSPCHTTEENRCNLKYHIVFYFNMSKILCTTDCPVECNSIDYQYKLSFSTYPSKPYAEALIEDNLMNFSEMNKSDYEDLQTKIVKFNVYYDNFDFENYYEVAKMSPYDLLAYIGGTLGLFIGASFLSFIEIIEFILTFLLIYFENILKC